MLVLLNNGIICNTGDLIFNQIGTRGDGRNSLLVHETALWGVNVHGLPKIIDKEIVKTLPVSEDGKFELRGEIVVKKSDYPNQVHRSIAAGIFNRKASSIGEGKSIGIAGMNKIDSLEKCLQFDWPKNRAKQVNLKRAYYDLDSNRYYQETEIGNEIFEPLNQENLYFISYSFSEGDFNRDNPEILKSIPGVRYVDNIEGLEGVFKVTDNPEEVIDSIRKFYGNSDDEGYIVDSSKRQKNFAEFAIDGIVIKQYNDTVEAQELRPHTRGGKLILPHDPKNVVAVKLKSPAALTKIISIDRTETELGNVTIQANVVPFISEDGRKIERINLHNPEWLALPENSYLKEGAEILVFQSMDIISVPQPLNSVPEEVLSKLKENK